ncbi:hypothetical protein LTR84_004446 [Exophiala bonariae]|uniref:Amidase domain-containing protein n=1 Tax=Exophiala bonariae TaxID=1690606 RepID=A0AAV9N4P9_9EURO|nr:hypothetical protein LTR84_004446 [Exophiala bonariae]
MLLCRGIEVEELTICELQQHLTTASFTSQDLTQCYLNRMDVLNPCIKAVIETNPEALSIAIDLDTERSNGVVRSMLHGIPFLVKDNIATKDGMQTTAGCFALIGTRVPADADVVAQLRAAGCILLGKANLSEWASMRSSYYSEGYSSRGGQNRNPYNLAEHPGGSSSGSASAVAANFCAFSIGTETDGSLMFPADRCGLVSIKPTVGLTSTTGVIPEAKSLDTVGPFGRSVEDVALVLEVLADPNSRPSSLNPDYSSLLASKEMLINARFGMPMNRVWNSARDNAEQAAEYEALIELVSKIKDTGAKVYEVEFPSAEDIIPPDGWDWDYAEGYTGSSLSEFQVVKTEFYHGLKEYLTGLEHNESSILTLEDIVKYNIDHTHTEGGVPGTHLAWPTGQDNFDRCLEAKNESEEQYTKAFEYIRLKSREQGIDAALTHSEGDLDGLIVPISVDGGVSVSIAAKAGYPMITVPVGVDGKGVPFGIGLIQTAFREDLLIKYGSAIEDLTGPRPEPTYLNFYASNYTYIGTPPVSS